MASRDQVMIPTDGDGVHNPSDQQCVAALAEQKLNALATKQTNGVDRFVAVMVFPDAQLLVMSARVSSLHGLFLTQTNNDPRDQ